MLALNVTLLHNTTGGTYPAHLGSGIPFHEIFNTTKATDALLSTRFLDGGSILYVGLLVLFVWRQLCSWRCCGKWMQYANYCSLGLTLLLLLMVYDIFMFVQAAISQGGKSGWADLPGWLRPLVLGAPILSGLTYISVSIQTYQHVERIRDESAVMRHDRAVQVILLPLVYCTTAMTELSRLYRVTVADGVSEEEAEMQQLKGETCIMVGDLYEAWALYQFGKLTLELIEASIAKQGLSDREEERAAARALMVAHTAVESLAWVGTLSYIVTCVMQSGWCIYVLIFLPKDEQVSAFESVKSMFVVAGFLASCAAIYNVFIVETVFHHFLERYSPYLKFATVKFLVTFSYCQTCFFDISRAVMQNLLPGLEYIPILGDILTFDTMKFEVFYSSLLIIECFIVALMHFFAWGVDEEWYDEDITDTKMGKESREILDHGSVSQGLTYGSF